MKKLLENNKIDVNYDFSGLSNYLIIGINDISIIDNEQLMRISSKKNSFFLPVKKVQINNKIKLYYDITDKFTLSQFLKNDKLNKKSLFELIYKISDAYDESERLELNNNGILLDRKFIFTEKINTNPFFVYLPIKIKYSDKPIIYRFLNDLKDGNNLDIDNIDYLNELMNFSLQSEKSSLEFKDFLKQLKNKTNNSFDLIQKNKKESIFEKVEEKTSSIDFIPNEFSDELTIDESYVGTDINDFIDFPKNEESVFIQKEKVDANNKTNFETPKKVEENLKKEKVNINEINFDRSKIKPITSDVVNESIENKKNLSMDDSLVENSFEDSLELNDDSFIINSLDEEEYNTKKNSDKNNIDLDSDMFIDFGNNTFNFNETIKEKEKSFSTKNESIIKEENTNFDSKEIKSGKDVENILKRLNKLEISNKQEENNLNEEKDNNNTFNANEKIETKENKTDSDDLAELKAKMQKKQDSFVNPFEQSPKKIEKSNKTFNDNIKKEERIKYPEVDLTDEGEPPFVKDKKQTSFYKKDDFEFEDYKPEFSDDDDDLEEEKETNKFISQKKENIDFNINKKKPIFFEDESEFIEDDEEDNEKLITKKRAFEVNPKKQKQIKKEKTQNKKVIEKKQELTEYESNSNDTGNLIYFFISQFIILAAVVSSMLFGFLPAILNNADGDGLNFPNVIITLIIMLLLEYIFVKKFLFGESLQSATENEDDGDEPFQNKVNSTKPEKEKNVKEIIKKDKVFKEKPIKEKIIKEKPIKEKIVKEKPAKKKILKEKPTKSDKQSFFSKKKPIEADEDFADFGGFINGNEKGESDNIGFGGIFPSDVPSIKATSLTEGINFGFDTNNNKDNFNKKQNSKNNKPLDDFSRSFADIEENEDEEEYNFEQTSDNNSFKNPLNKRSNIVDINENDIVPAKEIGNNLARINKNRKKNIPVLNDLEEDVDDTISISGGQIPYLTTEIDGAVQKIYLSKPSFVLGRYVGKVDFVCQSNKVGKMHAEIISRDGLFYINDLESKNGTYINSYRQRIVSNIDYPIDDGDTLILADIEFIFHL